MSFRLNTSKFKGGKKNPDKRRIAKAETMRYLYAVNPVTFTNILKLNGILLKSENDFNEFVDLYEADNLGVLFDSDKFLGQMKISGKQVSEAIKNKRISK